MLGACGLGDIGNHFPDSDSRYKNISSLLLLEEVNKKMKKKCLSIVNIDCVLILEKPRVSKYFQDMKKKLSGILKISEEAINIKATTTEGLGFCGREEGIAAESAVLLE